MNQRVPPQVFVSSVFASLGDLRFRTYCVVESRGWRLLTPPAQEETATWSEAQLRSWCVEAVARSDLYIGLFWYRYGSLDHASVPAIAWTEIEYWEAVRRDKARLLYFFTDSPHPSADLWQRHLRRLVRLTGPKGKFARVKVVSRTSYDTCLQHDLDLFADLCIRTPLLAPGFGVDTPSRSIEVVTPYWPTPMRRFDADVLHVGVVAMRQLYSKAAYTQAIAIGVGMLSALRRFPPDSFPGSRQSWTEFLAEWDRAGSWVGIDGVVPDDIDTLWACRERLRVLALMGHTREVYAAAGSVAGALYRRGRVISALHWLEMTSRDLGSAGTPAALSTRASMLMAIGEWQEAETLLKRSVDAWARRGPPHMSLVKDLAKLGLVEAKWRKSRRGLARIDEALRIGSAAEHPAFLAQTLGLAVQASLALGDRDAATDEAWRFVGLCQAHHLWHQLSGLRTSLEELGFTPGHR